ncbi:MAG: hypothetical protein K9H25_22135 [Rhodospirillum sp.]|nr:hypothetical protein [Rhodospirillum sp.]MCF8491804.1 hypothetical protein [Rhodospirillum sp.]MCF8501884.1 hypothetical protein [Rhodospirillum sp.]
MASFMVKVAGEGLVDKAHRLADSGPTSGSTIIYEVTNVPDGVSIDAVIALVKKTGGKPEHKDYEISYASLTA